MIKRKKEKLFDDYKWVVLKVSTSLWSSWGGKRHSYLGKEDFNQIAHEKLWEIVGKVDPNKSPRQTTAFIITTIRNCIFNVMKAQTCKKRYRIIEHSNIAPTVSVDFEQKNSVQLSFLDMEKDEQNFCRAIMGGASITSARMSVKWNKITTNEKLIKLQDLLEDIYHAGKN